MIDAHCLLSIILLILIGTLPGFNAPTLHTANPVAYPDADRERHNTIRFAFAISCIMVSLLLLGFIALSRNWVQL